MPTAPKGLSRQGLRRILPQAHPATGAILPQANLGGDKLDAALLQLLAAASLRASELAGFRVGDVALS